MKLFPIHKQFRAFTLLELLVGMILSGIVLTATFSSYRIITKQYENYSRKSNADSEISFFISQLEFDFSNAKTISLMGENEIELKSKNKMLNYSFSEKQVLRNDFSRVDTFKVSVDNIWAFLKSEKIVSENSQIDELHIMINVDERRIEKIYLKPVNTKSEMDQAETDLEN